MFDSYFNQTVGFRKCVSEDSRGTKTYYPAEPDLPATIRARFEYRKRRSFSLEGENIVTEHFVLTRAKIETNDMLIYNGQEVLVKEPAIMYDLMGKESHREVRA